MTDDTDRRMPAQKFVPVCAIGASAGGVAALRHLFRQLPSDLGLAFVVILHLAPDEPSSLSEILSVCTSMPVSQIDDSLTLQPDRVYVIAPDRELVIDGDSVTARPFSEPRGQRAQIDMFFRSVAAARGDGVAIVLSGAGSDGALGVMAMKEAGGIIMVQEPTEAGFASMPQSAIATGAADFIAPIARLAERLTEVARSKEAVRSLDMDGAANDLRRIVALLRARTGHDFSAYKRATVMRRVLRRMQVCRTATLDDYADYLLTTPEEAQNLFSDLLISVTMFFRDEQAFEVLARKAIKPLVEMAASESEESVRAWIVGCATGEEAYSIAILLHEEMARQRLTVPFQIFATDLDEGALATAREGRYPRTIEADVSEERLARFFVDEGTHYRVRKELRESVLFAKHSVLKEPPFMRLDLISCRNLLIYLERALQAQICSIFHYGLRPGRYLFLGSAETVDAAADLFSPVDRQARIYTARPHAGHLLPILPQFAAPEQIVSTDRRPAPIGTERTALPAALHVAALENRAPPSALVDDGQNILHLSATAGRFILHSAGPVSKTLPAVVRPELRLDLRLALSRALDRGEPTVTLPTIVAFDQGRRRISMHVTPLNNEAQHAAQALVFFLDGGAVHDGEEDEVLPETRPDEVRRLYAELKASQEALIVSRSGHDASIQELRAANEELQSINEEYRSTAEELETSKEELQSINEELHTVNAELKSKLESISAAHSDLQNLTAATEIGTLFLDPDLRIKMFTPPVAELFNITRHDTGRAITDFTHQLDYDDIEEDARKVLKDLVPIEREVGSKGGRRYVMRLRPYRTVEDRIDGTVMTFVDISERARAEAALRESEARLTAVLDILPVGVAIADMNGAFLLSNRAMDRFIPTRKLPSSDPAAVVRWRAYHPDGTPLEPENFPGARALRGERTVPGIEMVRSDEDGSELWTTVAAVPLKDGKAHITGQLIIVSDIDALKRSEQALRKSEERLLRFGEASQDVLWIRNADTFQWEYLTPAFETIYGLDRDVALRGDNMANWLDLIVPEDRERAAAHLQRVRDGERVTFEYRIQRPTDGGIRWLRNTDFPITDKEGRIAHIGGIGHDITEIKETEEALAAAEQRQRALLEGIPQLVWRARDGGKWTWASPQWTAYTGRSDIASRDWGWLEPVHPDDRDKALQSWSAAAETGGFEVEYRIRQADSKSYRWFHTRATAVRNDAGAIVEWLGTSTDVDDLRSLQERQQVLVAELQHRTRNLMGIVRSMAENTVRASADLPDFRQRFRDRLDALARVQGLLSRLNEHGRVTFDELIETELSAMDGKANKVKLAGPKGIELRSSTVQMLAMTLHELATNAVKYGALQQPQAMLSVTWALEPDATDRRPWLHIDWRESNVVMSGNGGVPHGTGQGRELIERALPYQVNAKTSYALRPDGVHCTISIPIWKNLAEMREAGCDDPERDGSE